MERFATIVPRVNEASISGCVDRPPEKNCLSLGRLDGRFDFRKPLFVDFVDHPEQVAHEPFTVDSCPLISDYIGGRPWRRNSEEHYEPLAIALRYE